ncbi:MAG: glycosyltransferase family 2 protein [Prevotella sp.]|nr:glycosyltransferase family 2 protein [Prevotella sp.]MBQ4211077.1 glycosyltransferase family 2 protein [Prevotella sp.]
MEKLLTVVVPVYKVEKYINKCLDSLVVPDKQMERLEVLAVNDGTPDNSALMAKEYEKKYPQTFKVIDKENGGHGSAWNRGVAEATGKYIKFLDSDDWFDNEDFSKLINRLEECTADVVFCNLDKHYQKQGYVRHLKLSELNDGEIMRIADYDWPNWHNDSKVFDFWYCTYRTSMIKSVHPLFLEKIFYDDAILFIAPMILGETFTYFDLNIYHYLLGREGQTMNISSQIAHAKDYIKVCKSMIAFAEQHNYEEDNKKKFVNMRINIYIRNTFIWLNYLPKSEIDEAMERTWYPYVKEHFPYYTEPKVIKYYKIFPYWLYKLLYKLKVKRREKKDYLKDAE